MATQQSMPFIKNLASSDRKIRTSALSSLRAFLSARQVASALTPLDILKLWKGLFYALWMCDRAIPQQNLCNELADLIYVLPREAAAPWLRGFWATMSREWTGIDVLRMEKFLLLVRRVVGAGFKWMRKDGGSAAKGGSAWDASRVDDVLGLLGEWPFALEEEARIEQTLEGDGQISQKIAQATTSPAVRARSKESLADDRLPANRKPRGEARENGNTEEDQGDGGSWDGFDD
ncbi:uncharacterized protein THITE_66080 [Thermothielavioides terrestris NRRL 8126]|uniref:Ribosomal RNA-processing protein 1 n=1 Tax=Thermothielavioides terrestris (strain ATCC 38088 / NRRL 8126) TaxID=578455 RepID=G2QZV6_THETT|nr:uncharacterized protein THITE_66080 [Thermothielavioides terrestris NRRL 8126]AEO67230.1 hypothetical protein THITE_66080 [Thermothielavioides terrestris NRRL 8126]